MCILARERVCGVIWRLGPGVEGVAASQGHWVGASCIYGAGCGPLRVLLTAGGLTKRKHTNESQPLW